MNHISMDSSMPLEERLRSAVGSASRVLNAAEAQSRYGGGTEGLNRNLAAAVVVGEESDIPALLISANQAASSGEGFCLYPISSGNNWGYGSALPASDRKTAVIVDLSNLKAIPFFDRELGLVTVQPGVTQEELRAFLVAQGAEELMVPVTGAGPRCSLVGNALERGYGITPHMDHFAAVNSLKAYLPDGSRFQSALCELDRSGREIADKCFKWGVGPYLDGLFTQSGLGIVTEMTIRLREKPAGFDSFYLRFADDCDLEVAGQLVADILREQEGIVGAINLMDRRRVIAMMAPNPNGYDAHRVMTEAQVAHLGKQFDVPAWTVAGSIYGTPTVVAAARRDIKRRLRGVKCQALFSSGWLIKAGRLAVNSAPKFLLNRERGMIRALDMGIEIMRGVPNEVALPLCYWRSAPSNDPEQLDPARDRCGVLWYAPLVPARKSDMRQLVELVRDVCPKHQIEPMVTLTNFHHDSADSTIPILFNQQDAKATADAWACLDELVERGRALGLLPYRMNLQQQQTLLDSSAPCWKLVSQLRAELDPNGVLMGGRYGFR